MSTVVNLLLFSPAVLGAHTVDRVATREVRIPLGHSPIVVAGAADGHSQNLSAYAYRITRNIHPVVCVESRYCHTTGTCIP
ncbi:hypothetical protein BZA05DRAFT_411986 [Tricharina praecox]|uniref:uncharacterized protein n=1 Tax=Tricharina praecox TaxID=43433 RepID=UPI002220155B|nr:uncharacterized protein BZA05DRAFT_411986 [Tricharina praecox]KAI5842696.1 hypothetical protein BZA05DRAFT_411986 [Tricharina praecox]